jgi:hypothetical protein
MSMFLQQSRRLGRLLLEIGDGRGQRCAGSFAVSRFGRRPRQARHLGPLLVPSQGQRALPDHALRVPTMAFTMPASVIALTLRVETPSA